MNGVSLYCILGSKRNAKSKATIVDQLNVECAIPGPSKRLSDPLIGYYDSYFVELSIHAEEDVSNLSHTLTAEGEIIDMPIVSYHILFQ